ncbi:MAG: hypothetical protein M3P06_05260 [Acidobacteriota bacterium]|nr:hypothetical protein [Acidobacteriota bacterium]
MNERTAERLSQEQLAPYLSPYLTGGYKSDTLVIREATVGGGKIVATVEVVERFVSPQTGEFHLAVPVAMCVLFQVAIVYGCWNSGFDRKVGEIYLRKLDITCRREVTSLIFDCEVIEKHRRSSAGMTWYQGDFSMAGGSFHGAASFVMPSRDSTAL